MPEIENPTGPLYEPSGAPDASEGVDPRLTARAATAVLILAVLAVLAGLMAGHAANKAMLYQSRANNKWAFYQAKSNRAAVIGAKLEILEALDRDPGAKKVKGVTRVDQERWDQDLAKAKELRAEMEEVKKDAEEAQSGADYYMEHHVVLARAAIFFQFAISLCAMTVLSQRRKVWITALVMAGLGGLFLIGSFL